MKIHTTIDGTGRLSSEAWFWINFVGVLLVAAALRVAGLTWGMPFVYLCVPKIRFCNIGDEGHRELGVT